MLGKRTSMFNGSIEKGGGNNDEKLPILIIKTFYGG